MSGKPDWNRQAFNDAEAKLKKEGYEVINPAKNFGGKTDLDYHIYIGRSIGQLLDESNAIHLLEGWHESRGARMEFLVAAALGINFYIDRDRDGFINENEYAEWSKLIRYLGIAKELVLGDRNEDYGAPIEDFTRAWDIYDMMDNPVPAEFLPEELKAKEWAKLNIAQKISRQLHKPKDDNLIDLAGYVLCWKWIDTGVVPG